MHVKILDQVAWSMLRNLQNYGSKYACHMLIFTIHSIFSYPVLGGNENKCSAMKFTFVKRK